jgi:23S rRNA G2069 N7-methylase RlmK/C1962 C5-methylase RlmI
MIDESTRSKFVQQGEMLANRVKKRFKHLYKRFVRQQIDVFRLYDNDIPEIRAAVDWYAGHLVVAEYMRRQSVPEWLPMVGAAVARALDVPPDRLHLKNRWAGKQEGQRYERLDRSDQKLPVRERDLQFYVNLRDYVDTGLFSDHRNTRQMVRGMAAGKDFLNLYCYTGSFSCYAAQGGARRTVSVDRSRTAIEWARANLALNGFSEKANTLVQSGALAYLAQAQKEGLTFDLAMVDPPSYSTDRAGKRDFDIARDHPVLLAAVIEVLRPGATLYFSTNHQNFDLRTEDLPSVRTEEITALTIPEDYRRKGKLIHRCWRINI